MVGIIQPKNAWCACASWGENPKLGIRKVSQSLAEFHAPLSFVLGAKDKGQRVRQYEKRRNEVIPIVAEMTNWVVNHGPSNLSVAQLADMSSFRIHARIGGRPGGSRCSSPSPSNRSERNVLIVVLDDEVSWNIYYYDEHDSVYQGRRKQIQISMFFLSRWTTGNLRPFALSAIRKFSRPPGNSINHLNDKQNTRLLRVVERRVEERKRLMSEVSFSCHEQKRR